MAFLRLERKGSYALVFIERPKARNAIHKDMLHEMTEVVKKLDADPEIHVFIITSTDERAFVAGADIRAMKEMSPSEQADFCLLGGRTFRLLEKANFISIVAINGAALGGGLELALACDLRLAAKTASLGLPEVSLGLMPGFGGTQRLSRLVGRGIALEMILSGEPITAQRAYEIGLVNHVYPQSQLLETCEAFAQKLTRKNSPSAQLIARHAIYNGLDMELDDALDLEQKNIQTLVQQPDLAEGLAAFIEKREAKFLTRVSG